MSLVAYGVCATNQWQPGPYEAFSRMRLSWSQRLFLQINRGVGGSPALDRLMIFLAHICIFFLFLGYAAWSLTLLRAPALYRLFAAFTVLAFFFSYLTSYGIALLWRHERPVRELRRVHQLIHPFGTWKSFPSDHTIAVTILPLTLLLVGAPGWLVAAYGLVGAGVAAGRVYVGVHYPRDILGGFLIGLIGTLLSYHVLYERFLSLSSHL